MMRRFADIEARLEIIESLETGHHVPISTANTSNPPTDAQLDTAFGQPADLGSGFMAIVNDAGLGTNVYLVMVVGAQWRILTTTLAA